MEKYRKVFALLAIIALPASLCAQQRSMKEILKIAQKHFEEIEVSENATRSTESIQLIPSSQLISVSANRESFYLYNTQHDGFVLVSADEQMPEILGYSTIGYDKNRGLPPGLMYVMSGYAGLLDNPAASRAPFSAQSSVGSYIKTAWDQGAPYNNMCPRDGHSRAMTGCVATAAAQLMKYYEWPKAKPSGIIEYVTETKKIDVSIDLSDYGFAWDKMLDTYKEGQYTNAQASAVSKLMYAVGAVSKMDYSSRESAASFVDCAKGMNKYFAYDNDLYMLFGDFMNAEQWNELIVEELDNSRPVLMSGMSKGEETGHAFVLDGYETKGGRLYYHVNWGWSGEGDGYYLVNNMTPTASGIGVGMGSYNDFQMIVLNCQPDDGKTTPVYGSVQSLEVSKDAFDSGENILFDVTLNYLSCMLSKDFDGTLYFEFVDERGKSVEEICLGKVEFRAADPLVGSIEGLAVPSLVDGIYTSRMYVKNDNGKKIDLFIRESWPVIRVGDVEENALPGILQDRILESVTDLMGIEKKNASNQKLPAGFYIIGGRKVIIK